MPAIHATKFLADRLQKPASAESKKEPAKPVATKYEAGYGPGSQRAYNARYADRPAAYPMDAVKKDNARTGGTPAAPKDASSGQRSAKPAGLNSDADIAAFTRGASKASAAPKASSTERRPAAYPMSELKKGNTSGGGASATPKASPPSNKAKANGAPKLSNFGKAFKSARSAGKSEFAFGGKKYNTKLKGE